MILYGSCWTWEITAASRSREDRRSVRKSEFSNEPRHMLLEAIGLWIPGEVTRTVLSVHDDKRENEPEEEEIVAGVLVETG
uniref:Uncharacterized protein n=1 Tax=Zea mays TaxID=4577 RepID=A0A804NXI6_MAIZE